MAPVPPQLLSNDDQKLWRSYLDASAVSIPDTWDLYCMPNSFVLYTKLIRQLIRPTPFETNDSERIRLASAVAGLPYTLSDQSAHFVDPNNLVIRTDRNGNSTFINQPYNFLGILLSEQMFDFSQPIQVITPSKADVESGSDPNALPSGLDPNNCTKLDKVMVKVVPKVKEDTLQARGDLNYMFSAAIWFEDKGGEWQVHVADTLHPAEASLIAMQP